MANLGWYWHRMTAMGPAEIGTRALKKVHQWRDRRRLPAWTEGVLADEGPRRFPALPSKAAAPALLRTALERDTAAILAGNWRAFGHLSLRVDDPPRWHKDYLVGVDLESSACAFDLDHRAQRDGADIKVVWEPSRWYQLVRLAQAAWLLDHGPAGQAVVRWLAGWREHNAPLRGLNWTSALETGLRLIQLTWIDALMSQASVVVGFEWGARRASLLQALVPPHAFYTWRYRSFGSSANNHLLGELAGLVVASARWPGLERWTAPLAELQARFEDEVLAQFAPDGGNREQALGYHLFSWEFCWQAQMALQAAGMPVAPEVAGRIAAAARFYQAIKPAGDPWDFGDSDNAWVTPFFADETRAAEEWHAWFEDPSRSSAIGFWWPTGPEAPRADGLSVASGARPGPDPDGEPSPEREVDSDGGPAAQLELAFSARTQVLPGTGEDGWAVFPDSGYATRRCGVWRLRWDLSELGFLATAAHGHLDALHLSIWLDDTPLAIDPGTGAYYADRAARAHLASWCAHNGPLVVGLDRPVRRGTFLWGSPHPVVSLAPSGEERRRTAELALPGFRLARAVSPLEDGSGWRVVDSCHPHDRSRPGGELCVCWRFAPEVAIAQAGSCAFRLTCGPHQVRLELDPHWAEVEWMNPNPAERALRARTAAELGGVPPWGWCAPAFRDLRVCPFVRMRTAIGSGRTAGVAFRLETAAAPAGRGAEAGAAHGGFLEASAGAHGT